MHLIYGSAYLVIAATLSPSPSFGIFATRPPTAHFELDCAGKIYKIGVRERIRHIHHGWFTTNEGIGPLGKRAWAFQERLLARRVIHYSPSELVWECKTHIRCECSTIKLPNNEPGVSIKQRVARALAMAKKGEQANQAWHDIVSAYSARQLRIQNDRLPALSGLARQFASPQMGKYLAGIWYSQLPDALDWTIDDPSKPDGYRAPSWCWASLDGPVSHMTHGGVSKVEVIEAAYTPAGEDPYGEVSDGYIVVKGEFGPATKGWHENNYSFPVDEDEEVWALKLSFSDWNIWRSLLLKRLRRVTGAWERIGSGIEGDRCFEGREKSVVRTV